MQPHSYQHLLFKRGYLITDADPGAFDDEVAAGLLSTWKKIKLGSYTICYEASNPCATTGAASSSVTLIGRAVDPLSGEGLTENIVAQLHDNITRSKDLFFEAVDRLTGRFIILCNLPGEDFVLQDACGMKSVCYATDCANLLVSSHSGLIARLTNQSVSAFARSLTGNAIKGVRYFPGLKTPYEGVRLLTPNTLLQLRSRRVERFYPRQNLPTDVPREERLEFLCSTLPNTFRMLASQAKLAQSLTGGIDSRLTLAASRDVSRDILYFTYVNSTSVDDMYAAQLYDAEAAKDLCDHLGLHHVRYDVSPERCGGGLDEYLSVWRENTDFMRIDGTGLLSKVLYEQFPQDRIHIKSNVAEISRAFYQKEGWCWQRRSVSPAGLAATYRRHLNKPGVVEAFQEFIDVTDFNPAKFFNYTVQDIFYWEHRMGSWQALTQKDFDFSHDTLIIYNNRKILECLLAEPFSVRMSSTMFYEIISRLWKEALDVPVNGVAMERKRQNEAVTLLKAWVKSPRRSARAWKIAMKSRMSSDFG